MCQHSCDCRRPGPGPATRVAWLTGHCTAGVAGGGGMRRGQTHEKNAAAQHRACPAPQDSASVQHKAGSPAAAAASNGTAAAAAVTATDAAASSAHALASRLEMTIRHIRGECGGWAGAGWRWGGPWGSGAMPPAGSVELVHAITHVHAIAAPSPPSPGSPQAPPSAVWWWWRWQSPPSP